MAYKNSKRKPNEQSGGAFSNWLGPWPKRRTIVLLCSGCVGLAYFDRINLAVAVVELSTELKWTNRQVGDVLGAFFYGYLLSQVIGGLLAQRYGGKRVLGTAVFIWSTLTIMAPMAARAGSHWLIAARVALGLAEGVTFPVIYHIYSEWVPESERSRSVAMLNAGVYIGAVLSFILSPIIMVHYGWASIFHWFGAFGFVWLGLWMWLAEDKFRGGQPISRGDSKSDADPDEARGILTNDDDVKNILTTSIDVPDDSTPVIGGVELTIAVAEEGNGMSPGSYHPQVRSSKSGSKASAEDTFPTSPLHKAHVNQNNNSNNNNNNNNNSSICSEPMTVLRDLSKLVKSPVSLSIFWCHFCHNTGHYVIISWLPKYLDEELGIHGESLAIACMPYLAMVIGVVLASSFADKRIRAGADISAVRRFFTVGGFVVGSIFMGIVSFVREPAIALLGISIALACNGAAPTAGYEAAKLDITGPKWTGRLQAVSNTFATLAGIVGIPLVAVIRDATGSWSWVFLTISGFFASAAVVFGIFGRWKGVLFE